MCTGRLYLFAISMMCAKGACFSGCGLEGSKALGVMNDTSNRADGRHNADEPAEGAQGLQGAPLGGERLDALLHDVHLDLHSTL